MTLIFEALNPCLYWDIKDRLYYIIVESIEATCDISCSVYTTGTSPVLHYTIPPSPYSKTDKGAIGSNTCHLPEAVTGVPHVRMTNNLHHFVQK